MNINSILVTGASGYIGSRLAQHFVETVEDVRVFVRKPGKLPDDLKKNCRVVLGDVTRTSTLSNVLRGVDVVIHAAGQLGQWGMSYEDLFEVNVRGTINMIRAAFDSGVKRFIHISAGGVTGPLGKALADEEYLPNPVTDYERTKWGAEKGALELARNESLDLLVVRPTFTYGPGDPHKFPLFKMIQKERFVFIGSGKSTVHPVYIDDLVRGIELALYSGLQQQSIIIGGAAPVTNKELVHGIADALGVKHPIFRMPVFAAKILALTLESSARIVKFNPPLTQSRILALSRNWGYSIDKARRELNYDPKVNLHTGLRRTVLWYKMQGWL